MNIAEDVEGRIHAENPAKAKYKLNDVDGDDEGRIRAENINFTMMIGIIKSMLESLQKFNYKLHDVDVEELKVKSMLKVM